MKNYKSEYKGTEMDASWDKANTAVQGVKVNGEELPKDAEGKVEITLPETYTKGETDALLDDKQDIIPAYLKSASVEDNTLTLTPKEGEPIVFSPEKEVMFITEDTPVEEWINEVFNKNVILRSDTNVWYLKDGNTIANSYEFFRIVPEDNLIFTKIYYNGWQVPIDREISKEPATFYGVSGQTPAYISAMWGENRPILDGESGSMALSYDEDAKVLTFINGTVIIQYTWGQNAWVKTTIQLATSSDLAGKQDALSSQQLQNIADVPNKIGDAPSDSKQYARKDGAWSEVQDGSTDDYRLIRDVTLKEDVTEFLIDTDENGNPFRCKELVVCMTFQPGTVKLDWSYANVFTGSPRYPRLSFSNLNGTGVYTHYELRVTAYKYLEARLWLRNNTFSNPGNIVNNPTTITNFFSGLSDVASWITQFDFHCNSGGILLAGTRILIYGRVFDE